MNRLNTILVSIFVVAVWVFLIWLIFMGVQKDEVVEPIANTTVQDVVEEEVGEVVVTPEPEPAKRLMIRASYSYYAFPPEIRNHYDTEGNLTYSKHISDGAPLRARDLWVLQKINETINTEVDPNAPPVDWPANMHLSTDDDRVATYSKWQCSGGHMTERDDFLLDALTDIRRGRNPRTSPAYFSGILVSESDLPNNSS